MLIVKIKVCGITNYKDASAAIDMGADLIGFNFYSKSKRFITPEKARDITNKLPAFVETVGVFVNQSIENIHKTQELCQLGWVQLHGDEDPQFCRLFHDHNVKIIKAIRVRRKDDIKAIDSFFTDAVLLDAFDPDQYGGTGKSFDWNIIGHANKRVFLAGGITPDNVAEAVKLGVYGVDVCSGIESKPGRKDHKKMQKLFDNIKYLRG